MATDEELTRLAKRMAQFETEPLQVERPRGKVVVRANPLGGRLVDTNVFSRRTRSPRLRTTEPRLEAQF